MFTLNTSEEFEHRGMVERHVDALDADVVGASPVASGIDVLLRDAGFAARLDALRARGCAPYEPWPSAVGEPGLPRDIDPLTRLLHEGIPADSARFVAAAPLVAGLRAHDLVGGDGFALPARWELTAFRGVLAVRDRAPVPGHGDVYIGEDGLRFVEAVQRERPKGDVLEVGSGSGLIAAAAAASCRVVRCIDIVPACVEATGVTAILNGVADRVTATLGDLTTVEFPTRFDCVMANLPGVPVPPGLDYSPAGDGGPDGLRLIRRLLQRVPDWLRLSSETDRNPVLLMRFQSTGDRQRPRLAEELGEHAVSNSWDVDVISDSRVPIEVRSALTTFYAAKLNPRRHQGEILDLADKHARQLGADSYYSSMLIARPGAGSVRFVDLAVPNRLDTPLRITSADQLLQAEQTIAHRYYCRLGALPDGFWELGSQKMVALPVRRLTALIGQLVNGTATLRRALHAVHGDEFEREPLAARSLYTTGLLLLDTLIDMQLAHVG